MNNSNFKITEYNTPLIEQRADPYVYKHTDGFYYFTASVPEYDRIILRKSRTIEGLKSATETIIWKKHDSGIMSRNIWAPELHFVDDKWYIYFAAGEMDDKWKIRPYVLECNSKNPIDGTWIEKGKIQRADEDEFSFEAFSLDGTVLEQMGNYYYIWAEKIGVGKMISNLYIAKMKNPWKLETTQVLLTTPDYDWERVDFWVDEAPSILKKNGKIFMTFSASGTGACYCIGLMTVNEDADLLDPASWRKSRYPVASTDSEKGIFGPGHNSFTVSEDGKDVMVFHARQYDEIVGDPLFDPNRHTMIMELEFNQDGTPIFNYKSTIKN